MFSAKHAKFKETQKKKKKTLFVNTIVLTALVKMSVFLYFSFLLFFQFPFFRDVFDWFPTIKKHKKKNQRKQNKKQEQKEDKICKAKTNEIL